MDNTEKTIGNASKTIETVRYGRMGFSVMNFIEFFTAISPFLLVFLFFMISAFNQDAKGFVYFMCVLFLSFCALFMKDNKGFGFNPDASPVCGMINFPYQSQYYIPYFNSIVISFTFAYILVPMILTGIFNVPILMFIAFIFIGDAYIKWFRLKCTTFTGLGIGTLLGAIMGIGISVLLFNGGMKSLLFFANLPDGSTEICSIPKNQTFRCSVYRNGELLTNL